MGNTALSFQHLVAFNLLPGFKPSPNCLKRWQWRNRRGHHGGAGSPYCPQGFVVSMDSELTGVAMLFFFGGDPVAFNIPHFNSIPLIDFWIFLVSSLGRSGKIAPEKSNLNVSNLNMCGVCQILLTCKKVLSTKNRVWFRGFPNFLLLHQKMAENIPSV